MIVTFRCSLLLLVLPALAAVLAGCGLYATDAGHAPSYGPRPAASTTALPATSALTIPLQGLPAAQTSVRRRAVGESTAALRRRGCHPGDPRAGVNTPLRLVVKAPCVTVHGVVGCIFTDRGDGDTHLALSLDPGQSRYLTPGNRVWTCAKDQRSDSAPRLVVEVIPQHCTARPDNCADRGHFRSPRVPPAGSHVSITGAWVLDTSTREGATLWAEIHPAFRIVVEHR